MIRRKIQGESNKQIVGIQYTLNSDPETAFRYISCPFSSAFVAQVAEYKYLLAHNTGGIGKKI